MRAPLLDVDPVVGAPVDVGVGGDLWWGGFHGPLLTVTNQSDQTLDDWALSFSSAHRFYGEAWGVEVVAEQLSGDLYRYQLSGADCRSSRSEAGESRTVGFNALAGTDLARDGALGEDTLLAAGTDFTQVLSGGSPCAALRQQFLQHLWRWGLEHHPLASDRVI